MFSRTKLGAKIGVALTLSAVVVVAVGTTGLVGMSSIIEKMSDVTDQKFPSMHSELMMLEAQQMIARGINASMLPNISVDQELRREAKDLIQVGESQLNYGRRKFEALPHSKAATEEWAAAMAPIDEWKKSVDATLQILEERERLIDGGESSVSTEVVILYNKAWDQWNEQSKLLVPAQVALRKLAEGTMNRTEKSNKEAQRTEVMSRRLLLGVGIAGALMMMALAAFFWRTISKLVRSLTTQASRLTDAVAAGTLDVRADSSVVAFEFRGIVDGMNQTMDAFVKPIQVTADYVDRISKGDLPPKIADDYAGDFDVIKRNLNTCIDAISRLIDEMSRMSAEHDKGETDAIIDPTRFQGAYATMAGGLNRMVAGHLEVNQKAMACVTAFGDGDFDAPLERFPGKKAAINDTIEKVRTNLKGFIAEMNRMSAEHDKGDIDVAIDAQRFQGDFRKMAQGVNDMVAGHVAMNRKALACVGEFGQGNFEAPLDRFPGKKAFINEIIEQVRHNLKAVIADVDGLATAAVGGQLSVRADAAKHQNDFRKIVQGINATLDAILGPIQEATEVLEKLAHRDLRGRMQGSYQGDHAKMKEALNATAQALHDALAQVAEAVSQVSGAAGQIAASSQSVADGASEQASSLQETGASLETMSTMTRQAADNAQQANGIAQSAKDASVEGGAAMEQMTGAMRNIKAAAEGTSQIIRDINEIAFQTNLLALNAAVEAARAGDAGRGFAVVAEEVRSLALRSKEAAMKTEQLIRESVNQAGEGETTAGHVNAKLGEITGSVTKVTDIIAEIAASAKEQAAGIQQVSKAVLEMDRITQQNAANSEESSSAAAELSSQSEELAAMVGTFQLQRGVSSATRAPQPQARPATQPAPGAHHLPAKTAAPQRAPAATAHLAKGKNGKQTGAGIPLRPEDVIPLAGDAPLDDF